MVCCTNKPPQTTPKQLAEKVAKLSPTIHRETTITTITKAKK